MATSVLTTSMSVEDFARANGMEPEMVRGGPAPGPTSMSRADWERINGPLVRSERSVIAAPAPAAPAAAPAAPAAAAVQPFVPSTLTNDAERIAENRRRAGERMNAQGESPDYSGSVPVATNRELGLAEGLATGYARGSGQIVSSIGSAMQMGSNPLDPNIIARLGQGIERMGDVTVNANQPSASLAGKDFNPTNWRWWTEGAAAQAPQFAVGGAAGKLAGATAQGLAAARGAKLSRKAYNAVRTAGFVAPVFPQEAGGAMREAVKYWEDKGLSPQEAMNKASLEGAATGAMNTVFEIMPGARYMAKTVPGFHKFFGSAVSKRLAARVATGFVTEGGTEVAQEAWGDTMNWLQRNNPKAFEGWQSRYAGVGAMGGVMGGGVTSMEGGGGAETGSGVKSEGIDATVGDVKVMREAKELREAQAVAQAQAQPQIQTQPPWADEQETPVLEGAGAQVEPPEAAPEAPEAAPEATAPNPTNRVNPEWEAIQDKVYEVPLKEIRHDPELKNFKEGTNEHGVVEGEELKGKFSRTIIRPIALWSRLDGKLSIITGRHRLRLADVSGEETIPSQIFREDEGFDLAHAKTMDAWENILDGKGTIWDHVNYFRNSPELTEATAFTEGLLSGEKGRLAFSISRRGENHLYEAWRDKSISAVKAAAIADAAPNNAPLQAVILKIALNNPHYTPDGLRNYAHNLSRNAEAMKALGPMGAEEQIDMLDVPGMEAFNAAQERLATAASAMQKEYQAELSVLNKIGTISKRDEKMALAKSNGIDINIDNAESVATRSKELQALIVKIKKYPEFPDMNSLVHERAGLEPPSAQARPEGSTSLDEIQQRAFDKAKEATAADRATDVLGKDLPSAATKPDDPFEQGDMFGAGKKDSAPEAPVRKEEPGQLDLVGEETASSPSDVPPPDASSLSPGQKKFIDGRVANMKSVAEVDAQYKGDDAVGRYARALARERFGKKGAQAEAPEAAPEAAPFEFVGIQEKPDGAGYIVAVNDAKGNTKHLTPDEFAKVKVSNPEAYDKGLAQHQADMATRAKLEAEGITQARKGAESPAKQPWEMTREEFRAAKKDGKDTGDVDMEHMDAVIQAAQNNQFGKGYEEYLPEWSDQYAESLAERSKSQPITQTVYESQAIDAIGPIKSLKFLLAKRVPLDEIMQYPPKERAQIIRGVSGLYPEPKTSDWNRNWVDRRLPKTERWGKPDIENMIDWVNEYGGNPQAWLDGVISGRIKMNSPSDQMGIQKWAAQTPDLAPKAEAAPETSAQGRAPKDAEAGEGDYLDALDRNGLMETGANTASGKNRIGVNPKRLEEAEAFVAKLRSEADKHEAGMRGKLLSNTQIEEIRRNARAARRDANRFEKEILRYRTPPSAGRVKTQPQQHVREALGTGSKENDQRLQQLREKVKRGRGMTAGDEKSLAVNERRVKADPSKWKSGEGVGYRVGTSQINRGFRILSIDPDTKTAVVRQVADTGLTRTGGDSDKFADMRMHIADLVRDKKYDAPVKDAPPKSPAANAEATQEQPTEAGGSPLGIVAPGFRAKQPPLVVPEGGITESKIPEVEASIQKSKGLGKIPFLRRKLNQIKEAMQGFTRHHANLDPRKFAAEAELFLQAEAIQGVAHQEVFDAMYHGWLKNLNKEQNELFTNVLLRKDLLRNVENGLYKPGDPLPHNYPDEKAIRDDLAGFEASAKANPEVQYALDARNAFVEDLAQKGVDADLLPATVLKDAASYFHHQVLAYRAIKEAGQTEASGASGDMRLHGRGWQKRRTSNAMEYNTDYVQSEFEYMSQMLADIRKKKMQGRIQKVSDISAEIRAKAEKAGDAKGWRKMVPEGYVIWQKEKGNYLFKIRSLPEKVMEKFLTGELDVSELENLREVLAVGQKKTEWVVPKEVASVLDTMTSRREASIVSKFLRPLNKIWKQWTLLNPVRVIKYNINNVSGDLDGALAVEPRILLPRNTVSGFRELKSDARGNASRDIQAARERNVIGNTLTLEEISGISEEAMIKDLRGERVWLGRRYWNTVKTATVFRENILRLAAYKEALRQVDAGKRPVWASQYEEMQGLYEAFDEGKMEREDIAAKLANDALGNYSNISENGMWIRQHMVPFYSWMEVNFKRYKNLFRNAYKEGAAEGAAATGRVGLAVGKKVAVNYVKLAIAAQAMYGLIELWNRFFHDEELEQLSEKQRREHHIILGKTESGDIRTIRFQGAFSDILNWAGLEDYPQDIADVKKDGMVAVKTKVKEAGEAAVDKIANASLPILKGLGEAAARRSLYPNVFNPRAIRDRGEHLAKIWSADIPYRMATGKPSKGLFSAAESTVVYKQQAGEGAMADTRKWVKDFREKIGEESPAIEPVRKSNALYYYKQAVRYKDQKAMKKYLTEYRKLGGTPRGMKQSVAMANPLYGLDARQQSQFLSTLTPAQRKTISAARRYYEKTYRP